MLAVGKTSERGGKALEVHWVAGTAGASYWTGRCLPVRLRTSTIGLGDKYPSETNIGVASLHDQALGGLATRAGTPPGVSNGEEKMRAAIQRLQGDGAVAQESGVDPDGRSELQVRPRSMDCSPRSNKLLIR
jgi:hypothetical protein